MILWQYPYSAMAAKSCHTYKFIYVKQIAISLSILHAWTINCIEIVLKRCTESVNVDYYLWGLLFHCNHIAWECSFIKRHFITLIRHNIWHTFFKHTLLVYDMNVIDKNYVVCEIIHFMLTLWPITHNKLSLYINSNCN